MVDWRDYYPDIGCDEAVDYSLDLCGSPRKMMNSFHLTSAYCAHPHLAFCYVSRKMVLDDDGWLRIFDSFRSLYSDKLWPNLTMKMRLITSIKVLSLRKLVSFGWKVVIRKFKGVDSFLYEWFDSEKFVTKFLNFQKNSNIYRPLNIQVFYL